MRFHSVRWALVAAVCVGFAGCIGEEAAPAAHVAEAGAPRGASEANVAAADPVDEVFDETESR